MSSLGAGRGIRTPEAHKGHRLAVRCPLKACAFRSIVLLIRSAIPARYCPKPTHLNKFQYVFLVKSLLVTTAGYRVLPHTTDAYIEACGATLEEAFSHAARALFDTLCNINSITESISEEVKLREVNELTLLYDWLENLLLKFELEGKVYSKFNVTSIARDENGLVLNAIISGEMYDKYKHEGKVEVKAVTFHRMEIISHNSSTVLRFVLDL